MRASSVVVAVVAAAGCGQDPVLVCHDGVIEAVTVVVRDSVANAPITQELGLVGVLRDGPYTEQMYARRDSELAGGGDRPGNYEVEIRAEGYRQVENGANQGRESSNYIQDCTICVSCRWAGPYWTVRLRRENRVEWRESPSALPHALFSGPGAESAAVPTKRGPGPASSQGTRIEAETHGT